MQGYDVYCLSVHLNGCPSCAVRYDCIFISCDPGYVCDRVLGCDYLRIIVSVAAYSPVFVSVAPGKLAPVLNKIAVFLVHLLIRICLPYRLCLAPYADVRILCFYKFDKTVIIVVLAVPHSVLDVPVKKS